MSTYRPNDTKNKVKNEDNTQSAEVEELSWRSLWVDGNVCGCRQAQVIRCSEFIILPWQPFTLERSHGNTVSPESVSICSAGTLPTSLPVAYWVTALFDRPCLVWSCNGSHDWEIIVLLVHILNNIRQIIQTLEAESSLLSDQRHYH